MIPGFDYGVQGMKVGGTRNITIPPELGYGSRESGPIPANSTLIFEVKLEKVE
jgi:FKBP-type peptidyl-prolyl cis-trans isomerase